MGGRGAPDTRAKNNANSLAGTWGLTDNSKMAALRHGLFFYRVSSISKVCIINQCLFELQCSIVLFPMYHLFFWKLTYFSMGFLHVHASSYFIFHKNTKFKNLFMLSVRISSYGCTREVWRA